MSHRLRGSKPETYWLGSGAQKSQIKVSAGMVSSVSPSVVLLMAVSLLCLPLCVCVLVSSYKDNSHIGLGISHMTSFYLNYFFKDSISKYSPFPRYW